MRRWSRWPTTIRTGDVQHGSYAAAAKETLMPKGFKAGELVKSGAKKAASNKAVDRAVQNGLDKTADKAIAAVFGFATGGAAAAVKRKRDRRKERRDAADLARQVGGTFSLNVIIGSERHHVVWLADETPYRVIPQLPNDTGPLEELPDLRLFRGLRQTPKPRKS
jgi:hypothetical protein